MSTFLYPLCVINTSNRDLGLDHETAEGVKGFESVVHGDQGLQNSQEAKHARMWPMLRAFTVVLSQVLLKVPPRVPICIRI